MVNHNYKTILPNCFLSLFYYNKVLFTEEKWQKQKRKRLIRVLVLVFNLKNEDFGSILTMSKCFISQNEVGCSGFMFCNDYDDIYEFTKKKMITHWRSILWWISKSDSHQIFVLLSIACPLQFWCLTQIITSF